jgi:carboxymethylenebutenolidase
VSESIRVRSRDGGEFDCYVAAPQSSQPVSAIVLAAAIHGVDDDIRAIADEFASRGFIAAAPDLFWRTVPGPLPRDDPRASPRGQPRLERIRAGEADVADVLDAVKAMPPCNGRAAIMGFCYGGPYAILGPKRLGYDAGISCHGSQMLDYLGELDGVRQPVCVIWGDQDAAAPANVLDAYRAASSRMANVEVHVRPGVLHGYMMKSNPKAYDAAMYAFSMERALALLGGLNTGTR